MSLFKSTKAKFIEAMESYSTSNPRRFNMALKYAGEKKLQAYGKLRAEVGARRTWERVPAYRDFLKENNISTPNVPFEQLPTMSKDGYIRAYPTDQRCLDGTFLNKGVMIDESSGSTGLPYNWVRSEVERARLHKMLVRSIEWVYGHKPRIAINAFSMGAWATGVNTGETLALHSVVKSTGPDLDKIIHTLKFFGPKHEYIICGYPPFLKLIIDSAAKQNIDLDKYTLHGLVGGEGMSEELRQHLLGRFKTCISAYGASDLEMGIAVESPESIQIRGLLNNNSDLRSELLGDHRVPMVFQYNPMTHFAETNDKGELIFTMNYSKVLSPRIRYNIGDEGKLFSRSELLDKLINLGFPVELPKNEIYPTPYMMLFGRKDQTISVMGANIYPEDIERLLYRNKTISQNFVSFMMKVTDSDRGYLHPCISIEWNKTSKPELPIKELEKELTEELVKLNADFKNASDEYPSGLMLELEVFPIGTGPFAGRSNRIKNKYIAQ